MTLQQISRYSVGAVVLATLAACSSSGVSDTGYSGTWTKGNDSVRSTIAIAERDGRWFFRWGKASADGRLVVRCDWNGDCVHLSDGQEIGRYHFRAWMNEENGRLRVECRGRMHGGPDPEVHYVDEAVVRDEGKRLVIRRIELNGTPLERRGRPKFTFTKVSDSVPDPSEVG